MLPQFIGVLALISVFAMSVPFFIRLHRLHMIAESQFPPASAHRYQPMLRLLSEEDLAMVAGNKALRKKLKRERLAIFRGYLRCLTKDYARLLAGVRLAMVNSTVDRPDLARALVVNKILFAIALYRIEIRLFAHTFGLAKVDVSGLVEAMENLRAQASFASPAPFGL